MLANCRRLVSKSHLHVQQGSPQLSSRLAQLLDICGDYGSASGGAEVSGAVSAPDRYSKVAPRESRRPIFSLPGFDDSVAKKYTERKLMGYSPRQMYDVVAAVEHYHKFVPWCQKSSVLRRQGDTSLEAELEVGFQIFTERYVSKVTLEPYSVIRSQVGESTLFSHLNNAWHFSPGPTPHSVWLQFDIDFAFKSPLYRQVASLFFEEVVQRMMSAFEGRCAILYGPSSLHRRPLPGEAEGTKASGSAAATPER